MRRKKYYKRKTFKNKAIEKIYTYFIMAIVILFLFIILNKLTKSNIINIEKIKTDIKKVQEIIKKVEPEINIIRKKKPVKPVVINKITRSDAYRRGMDIINYVWTYNSKINGVKKDQDAELPNYLIGVNQLKTAGLPYCWGGFTSLDTSNQKDVKNFADALRKGYSAGNVKCTGNYKYFTAGLDCSGFICAVFKIPEKCDTGSLDRYFDVINEKDLKPMDIMNCSKKHVFIYLGESEDKKGVLTMEASYNTAVKNSERTKINFRTWDSIKKGTDGKPFVPMRYKGIIEDSAPSFKDPREFNSTIDYSVPAEINKEYEGYIDYADDLDYFKINIGKSTNYNLELINNPKSYNFTLSDANEKSIINVYKQGPHILKLTEGIYYLKIWAKDFRFNADAAYSFAIKNYNERSNNVHSLLPKQKLPQKPVQKSTQRPQSKSVQKSTQNPQQKLSQKTIQSSQRKLIQKSLKNPQQKSLQKPLQKPEKKTVQKPLQKSQRRK